MVPKQRFPWVGTGAVAAFVVVMAAAGLELPADRPVASARATRPALALARAGQPGELLAEQLAAYDPAPLFVPSRMGGDEVALPEAVRPGVGGPFAALPPELTKTGPLEFPPPVALPRTPVEGLRLTERPGSPLSLQRTDTVGEVLAKRMARVDAVQADTGRVVLSLSLPISADLPQVDWQPLELTGAVTRSGLAGDLVVTASSGLDEIDEYFRSHLRKNVRIGERLPVGFYVFRVGP